MNRRQTFLALAATLFPIQRAFGGPYRRSRCGPTKAKSAITTTGDSFIQPDYAKWSQVKEGMTEAEVLDLLGKPLEQHTEESFVAGQRAEIKIVRYLRSSSATHVDFWTYGQIKYGSPVIPSAYRFVILFDDGRVACKCDPFHGKLSPDGKPTTPNVSRSLDRFDHYPRFVDLRWGPSSGEYPMEYEIMVSHADHVIDEETKRIGSVNWVDATLHSRLPHITVVAETTLGRWKVKAKNRLGESDWSETQNFHSSTR